MILAEAKFVSIENWFFQSQSTHKLQFNLCILSLARHSARGAEEV